MAGSKPKIRDFTKIETFTTGEAAIVCRVSQQTIIRNFDAGRLGGHKIPGSKFRRIPRAELIKFMTENNLPQDKLNKEYSEEIVKEIRLVAKTMSAGEKRCGVVIPSAPDSTFTLEKLSVKKSSLEVADRIVSAIQEKYGDEVFISRCHAPGDDLRKAIADAISTERKPL